MNGGEPERNSGAGVFTPSDARCQVRTIAIVNQKGGCGKTTTAVSLAAVFANRGLRTLLVDLDPQSHCALGLGVPQDKVKASVADALVAAVDDGFDPRTYLFRGSHGIDLMPSTVGLAGIDSPGGALAALSDRDVRLQRVLDRYADTHDLCLIDCPPTLSVLTYSAMRSAREVLVPVETSYFAYRGAREQWNAIQSVIERIRRPIACHMLPTLHRSDSRLSRDILAELQRTFAGLILPLQVGFHEALREAAALGMAITEYDPSSGACRDYEALAEWLVENAASAPTIEVDPEVTTAAVERARASMPPPTTGQGSRAKELADRLKRSPGAPAAPRSVPGRDAHSNGTGSTNGSPDRPASAPPRPGNGVLGPAGDDADRGPRSVRVDIPRATLRVETSDVTESEVDAEAGPRDAVEARLAGGPVEPVNGHADDSATVDGNGHVNGHGHANPNANGNGHVNGNGHPNGDGLGQHTPTIDRISEATERIAARVAAPVRPIVSPDPMLAHSSVLEASTDERPARLLGVHLTERGVLFTQPLEAGRHISVVGDFNGWAPNRHVMRPNEDAGVQEILIPVPAGRHRYRVVIDGRWEVDGYNTLDGLGETGDRHSVVDVPRRPEYAG